MKELQNIVAGLESIKSCGRTAVIATVVEVEGSAYRRPGARMLMTQDGQRFGSISGGCLEDDVFEHAQAVMRSHKPILVNYDTASHDDLTWGLGLGCNGLVRVLIEQVASHQAIFLSKCYRDHQLGIIATLVRLTGQLQEKVGTRLMLEQDGSVISHIFNSALAASILKDATAALHHQHSTLKLYQLPVGEAEVFIDVIQPPVPLVIFGAGHDALPVVRFAKELGWNVTVVDTRQSAATQERFPCADTILLCRPESITENLVVDERTVAVVMTHNYLHDHELLKILLPSQLRYLGILGSKNRTERLLEELSQAGINPTKEQMHRLYTPVGLDIGSDTPEEIALSIIAEIQAVIANRPGSQLRERKGSIHDRIQKQDIQLNQLDKPYVGV